MTRMLLAAVALLLVTSGVASGAGEPRRDHRMIVLGIDGMDPQLLQDFMKQGVTPNLSKLAAMGGFMPLGTSTPPQSPVAWSNLITGMDPGGHGIFDFIALDRDTLLPYLSTSRTEATGMDPIELGDWIFPLGGAETQQLRDGRAFWELLEEEGIPARLFRMPANYPPIDAGTAISGMGTPDMRGTPGTFMFFTDDPDFMEGPVSGGLIRNVYVEGQRVNCVLEGPPNPFRKKNPYAKAPFTVDIDPSNAAAVIRIGDEAVVLQPGEWSEWVPVDFELVPWVMSMPGMVRFYLKELEPRFKLYVSPVNIDPGTPAQTISTPSEYSVELARATGRFHTQEMPEDTKALSRGVLTPTEFLQQSNAVLDERRRLLRHELQHFRDEQRRGFLFFYISSVDQRAHVLYRQMDREHPAHEPDTPLELQHALRTSYAQADEMVGWVLEELEDDTTFIVMSDHGFSPFRREANLNTWLEDNGYLTLENPSRRHEVKWLYGVDWSRTRAFAIGLNSLYLNVRGRESKGIVDPSRREALAREIAGKLAEWKDPKTGARIVTNPALREDIYHGPHVESAPDILVGYGRTYRASWGTTTGEVPLGLVKDNTEEWSGDHCMDARVVPGVLLANRPLQAKEADLRDLTVTILKDFGLRPLPEMKGQPIF